MDLRNFIGQADGLIAMCEQEQTMPEFYVQVEAVNLDNFIGDVHDLNTIRGGSFLLLDAVRRVRERFQLTPISTGASSGVFTAPATGGAPDANALRREIEAFLNDADGQARPTDEIDQLKHATFVVDVCCDADSDEGFARARGSLTAMNRWRQFQQPTVAVPSSATVQEECRFDHIRPATTTISVTEGEQRVEKPASASVAARRNFGIGKKTSFYKEELRHLAKSIVGGESWAADERNAVIALAGSVAKTRFTNDLETLADDGDQGSLNGKIAVLYFDGNGFRSIQRKCDRTDLTTFDRTVKRYRGGALRRLLERVTDDPNGWLTPGGEVRLETLLWGGDELIWVVPAWKGWGVLQLFYETSREWKFTARDGSVKPLTHAGGAVFCHRAAPIHRMTALAHSLADSCKQTFNGDTTLPNDHPNRDVFAYQVLESFDHIGTEFETFRKTRVPQGRSVSELIVRGAGMGNVASEFDVVRRTFPRSKLHAIVAHLRDDEAEEAKSMIRKTVGELPVGARSALSSLFTFFGRASRENAGKLDPWEDSPTVWYHLADLLDYAI